MGKVIAVISTSLDGFITGASVRADEPMGDGGQRLHDWAMGDNPQDREILTQGIASTGAVITGRHNYDMAIPGWQADGPTGPARLPVFVVSHSVPVHIPANGVYRFVNGIEKALADAQAAAGDKVVSVMGGANIIGQYLKARLVDELQIQMVPVLFGSGIRLYEAGDHIELEPVNIVQTANAIHMRFRVVK